MTSSSTSTAELVGLRAVVTGATRGIGSAIATQLLKLGAAVVAADLPSTIDRETASTQALREAGAIIDTIDVRDSAVVCRTIESAAQALSGIDVLVNNAGVAESRAPVDQLPEDEWLRVIDTNLGGVYRCSRAAWGHLARSGRGAIVNLSSTWGLGGVAGYPAYCASKTGIIGLTREMAADGGPLGVRVNAVSPGYVANDMGDVLTAMAPDDARAALVARNTAAAYQPLGRQCDPFEIATAVAFLVSPAASFITGAVLPVDGGQSGRLNTGELTSVGGLRSGM